MDDEHEFAIPVRDLDAAGKPFRFPVTAAWVRSALEGTDVSTGGGDGKLDLRLSKSGTDVVVRGTLEAALTVPCARCLEPTSVAVKETISALVVPATVTRESAGAQDDDDVSADQADLIAYDGETVVLDELIRDELLLGIPMIPLGSEGCPGIRPEPAPEVPAEAKGIDPRLRPLLRLKKTIQ
jgi:uncharacterized protein